VVERFAARLRVHFLRVVGAGAYDVMRVVRGMDDDLFDRFQILDALAHAEGEVDQRLALVFG
jgi:hypothetical protein